MKVGSLVVVLPLPKNMIFGDGKNHSISWLPKDDENTPYVIKEISKLKNTKDCIGVTFEEGVMVDDDGDELYLNIEYVREIMSPDDMTNINEMVDEFCMVKVER